MKKLLILWLCGLSATAQNKQSVGINLPLWVDNTLEISYKNQIHRKIDLVLITGGATKTRGYFRNGSSLLGLSQGSVSVIDQERISGFYIRAGANAKFSLPDFSEDWRENPSWQLYVGPVVGLTNYGQSGIAQDYHRADNFGQAVTFEFNEKGLLTGTGFSMGLKIGASRAINADLGFDFVGFDRKTQLGYQAHTLGVGRNGILRINYSF